MQLQTLHSLILVSTALLSWKLGCADQISVDNTPPWAPNSTDPTGEDCVTLVQTATSSKMPVDIIFSIDSSGSMWDGGEEIQRGLNELANTISSEGIDAHIVLLAATEENDCFDKGPSFPFCVAEPLGSGQCGGGEVGFPADPASATLFCEAQEKAGLGLDSNEPLFLHLNVAIDSTYSIQAILYQYPQYRHLLREEAHKQFVVVDDIELPGSLNGYSQHLKNLDPPILFEAWTFNAVYCQTHDCVLCDAEYPSGIYADLVLGTGGFDGDLCQLKRAFENLIDALAQSVIVNTPLACEWRIPTPSDGQSFDKDKVNVKFTSESGEEVEYGKVAGDCGEKHGWKYDNEASPLNIVVCPATCDEIQSDETGQIDIIFGCETVVVI